MKTIIISGSSRKNGETSFIVEQISELLKCSSIHLIDYKIGHYDYESKNRDDDFISLISEVISKYDTIIFATPVYWYSMSGILKVFFDRITDLLTTDKELGRKLRGKNMAVITSSNGNHLNEHFWLPFTETANYLGINYLGNTHVVNNVDKTLEIKNFCKLIK